MSKTSLKLRHKGSDILPSRPSKLRKYLYICLWVFWFLLLGLAILLSYGWTKRYDLLEKQTKQLLAERHIEAELEIVSIGQETLRLKDVSLRGKADSEAPPFFKADRIEAQYEWRDALRGQMKALSFSRAEAMVEIDAEGKIIGGWVPPKQSESETRLKLPENGIEIKDSQITIDSPYGRASTSIDGEIFDPKRFEFDLELERSAMAYGPYNGVISGPILLQAKNNTYAINTTLNVTDIAAPNISVKRARLVCDMTLDQNEPGWTAKGPFAFLLQDIAGEGIAIDDLNLLSQGLVFHQTKAQWQMKEALHIQAKNVRTDSIIADRINLISDANISLDRQEAEASLWNRTAYDGGVNLKADGFELIDTTLRQDLAKTLSLSDILAKSPILSDFGPELTQQTQDVLRRSDIEAVLSIDKTPENLTIMAQKPVTFSNKNKRWRVTPTASSPLLQVEPSAQQYGTYKGTSYFGFEKHAPLPLTLKEAQLGFALSTPTSFEGITDFSAELIQPRPWQTQNEQGQPVQLTAKPTDIVFNKAGEGSDFSAETYFTITGDIPGGYVTGLKGRGHVQVETKDANTELAFTAKDRIYFDHLGLTSGWNLQDGSLELETPFVMEGPPERRVINVAAKALKMGVNDGDVRDFQSEAARISGIGVLSINDGKLAQNWDLTLTDGRMTSPLFPISETDIFSPETHMQVSMVEGAAPEFDIKSAHTQVSSSLVSTDDIDVHIFGTPDVLTVDYDAQLFRFSDPSLPEIPMAGQTRLNGERWTGESVARLPEDLTTPIDISFVFEDGVGEADIDIKTLRFTRNKLQPQNLVSNLRGKIGDVEGLVSTSIKLGFGEGQPLTSSGWAEINNMDLGILAGPITGLNTSLEFTSFFPLETSGRQTVQVQSFDPGFPLANGEIEFELLPGKMKIYRAEWPMAGGMVYIEPLIWDFEGAENKAVLVLETVSIQDMIERSEDTKFEITGAVSGRLPVTISGVNVNVEGGKLSVPGGGVIRFEHAGTDLAGAQNRAAGVAFDALKNFEYQTLEADINGPLDGLIRLRTIFAGYNQKVFEGQPFEFDLELEGELLNLVRELNPETQKNRALSGDIVDLILNSSSVKEP